ncbi:hypothetical protein ABE10_01000, partial [Bacillus toyonensis]|nr:hypothetical protein [Bacillus toyonensis]
DHRRGPHQPFHAQDRRAPGPALDEPHREEQGGLHDDVVDDVVDGGADRGRGRDREPEHHVADMAHEGERQDPLQLRLGHGSENADDHGRERDDHQQRVDAVRGEELRLGADEGVHADLREQPREHRGDRGGGGGIRVRQPERDREDRRLDPERDHQEQMQHELRVLRDLAHPHRDLSHVDGAEGPVDHRDRREEEDRRHERHDDVHRARADPRLGAAQGDQHVRRHQEDLEADVEVEQVARDEGVED